MNFFVTTTEAIRTDYISMRFAFCSHRLVKLILKKCEDFKWEIYYFEVPEGQYIFGHYTFRCISLDGVLLITKNKL